MQMLRLGSAMAVALLCCPFAGLPALAEAQVAPTIVVRPTATVSGREIRLRDISDASGTLGDLVVAAAALPGRSCLVSRADIRLRLRAARVNLDQLSIDGPVTVTTQGAAVSGAVLVDPAIAALRKVLPWPAEDVTIEPVSVPRLPTLPGDQVPTARAGAPVLRSARSAVVPVTLTATAGSRTETRTVEVALRITVRQWAVVAARPIARHVVLGPEDVILARVEVGAQPALLSVADAIGKRAASSVLSGRPLVKTDLEDAPVVAANAPVAVRVLFGGVEVATTGTTREEGCVGQTIRVRLDPSPDRPGPVREVRARVADAQTVVVGE